MDAAERDDINIEIHGDTRTLPAGSTIADLLRMIDLADQPCAVEVNRSLVPKRAHTAHALQEGDTVEIVTLVGGG